jgi:hypothetical protein
MLPPFTDSGDLPPGIHSADWQKPRCRSFSRHGKLSGTEVGADY